MTANTRKDCHAADDKCLWEHTMWNNGHDAYLESRVLSADPVELVNLLYQACIQAVRDARYHLERGDIGERSRAINRACEIVMELNVALDRDRGGEIAARLAQLYDYVLGRLLEANMQQSDLPLAEVLALLATLGEAWQGVCPPAAEAAPAGNVWAQEAGPVAGVSHGWSL
jgi:flagellar protein FliS